MSRIRDLDHKYLYGTTGDFAQNNEQWGTIFRITPAGELKTLFAS